MIKSSKGHGQSKHIGVPNRFEQKNGLKASNNSKETKA